MNESLGIGGRNYGRWAGPTLATLFAVGTVGHAVPATLPLMLALTPGFLLATGALATAPSVAAYGWRFALWVTGSYVFTFAAEAVGVATGAVFGEYAYGPTLGWAWRGVPLVIALNWVLVVNGAVALTSRALPPETGPWRRPALALLAGALAAAFDFILEPAAIRLDYWHWAGGAIPLQNYAAWFVLAAATAAFHPRLSRGTGAEDRSGPLAGHYVVIQTVFFLALRIVWHFQGG